MASETVRRLVNYFRRFRADEGGAVKKKTEAVYGCCISAFHLPDLRQRPDTWMKMGEKEHLPQHLALLCLTLPGK